MSSPPKLTNVFGRNAEAFRAGQRYIINQGSARSSKTYSLLQLMHFIAKCDKPRLISVVSKTLPHLKRGAIRDFIAFLKATGQYDDKSWAKGDLIYTIGSSQIEFFSVDQPDKVYGPARDILFVNECNRVDEETFRQLAIRTRGTIFVDFNPTHEFYIHTDYKLRDNATYIHSTFYDNPYLDENIKRELIEAGERNENFRRVFVEGEIGMVEGTVFDNWTIGEFDNNCQVIYGQDYGFRNDPTTLIKVGVDSRKRKLYLHECFYKTGLSTQQIYELNKAHAGGSLIIGDSAEPRLIDELRRKGLNIKASIKGQGSISAGIAQMLDYEIIITDESHNIQKEFRNYVWLDKGSKLVIDDFNHGIDPTRYVLQYVHQPRAVGGRVSIPKYS